MVIVPLRADYKGFQEELYENIEVYRSISCKQRTNFKTCQDSTLSTVYQLKKMFKKIQNINPEFKFWIKEKLFFNFVKFV